MKRTCKQCGKEFELSESEISFYKSKGLELPKRCKSCRDKNKGVQQSSEQKQKIVSASQSGQSNQHYQNNNQNHHQKDKSYVVISAVAALLVLLVFVLKSVLAIPTESVPSEDAVSSNIQVRQETPTKTLSETPAETFTDVPSELPTPEEKDEEQTKELSSQQTEVQAQSDTQEEIPAETEIAAAATAVETAEPVEAVPETPNVAYHFRKPEYLTQHFQKHGAEFPYATEEEYLLGANNVIQNPNALHKLEAEDGDDVYYIEDTREFVIVSTDGYIRTYYTASLDYFNRQ